MRARVRSLAVSAFLLAGCAQKPAVLRREVRLPDPLPILTAAQAVDAINETIRGSAVDLDDLSILIVDLETGAEFYSIHPDRRRITASNMKLVTGAAALKILGPNFRFKTEIYHHEDAIWIKGGGDPTLQVLMLRDMARQIAYRMVKERLQFNGQLYLDDSMFEEYPWIADGFRLSGTYNTSLGPLSVNRNRVSVRLARELPVEGDVVPLTPRFAPDPEGFRILVDTAPVPFDLHYSPQYRVEWNDADLIHDITVLGPLRRDEEKLGLRRPTVHFGRVFAEVARGEGLPLTQTLYQKVPAGAKFLLAYESPPLYEIVRSMNLVSDNFIAEMLALRLGVQAGGRDRDAGLKAIADFLVKHPKLPPNRFDVASASGLTRRPQMSARGFVELLRWADRDKWIGSALYGSMPIGGWSGTMRRRLMESPGLLRVSAKTGLVDYVSGVTGFAVDADHRKFVFSILANDHKGLEETADWDWLRRESEEEWRRTTNIDNRFKRIQNTIMEILARTSRLKRA